jgi:hypothetical protein
MRKFLFAAAMGLSALAATPACAQAYEAPPPPPGGYYEESDLTPATEGVEDATGFQGGYDEDAGPPDGVQTATAMEYDRSYDAPPRRYRPGDQYRGDGVDYDGDPRRERRHRERRCSGTTGAILGGIAGALLGGDIGGRPTRYGYRRSGAGTVIGAGVGAVVGSEIDRDNCERARGYR